MHCTLTFTQFNWTTRTHCSNTTTYLLSLDTIQCRSMTLRIQLMYNLLHLCILFCVYIRLLTNQATNWILFTHDTAPLIMCWLLYCTPQTTSSSLLTSTWLLTHHIPLHMSLFDKTYTRPHPPGYLLWFHLCFLPLNSYHILMPTVLLTLSVPRWCLVLIYSAPYLPGQPVPLLLPLGYLSFSANIVLNSGLQKGYGANHKILLTLIFIDHSSLTSLLMSPLLKGHTIMTKWTIRLTLTCSLKRFPPSFLLLLPLLHQL